MVRVAQPRLAEARATSVDQPSGSRLTLVTAPRRIAALVSLYAIHMSPPPGHSEAVSEGAGFVRFKVADFGPPTGVKNTADAVIYAPAGIVDSHTLADAVRRVLEVALALAALVVAAPLMALIALTIRLDSPGPAVFRQQRVGRGGIPFTFFKFRTLYVDARERFPHLYAYRYSPEEIQTFCFKLKDDPRVTRVGRWLRKSTLDELPNFLNVVIGDMALVGPRPEIPEMLPYYRLEEQLKFSVRPGITGLAQTSGRGDLSFRETVLRDLEYVKRRSLRVDLSIIGRTLIQIVARKGAF